MKLRKALYIAFGIVFTLIGVAQNMLSLSEYASLLQSDVPYAIGYIIGNQILLVIGLLLLRSAAKLDKKIKALEEYIDLDEFGKDVK
jgi:hypothetical protein